MNIISFNISNYILFIYIYICCMQRKASWKLSLEKFFQLYKYQTILTVHVFFFIFIKFETLNLFRSLFLALDSIKAILYFHIEKSDAKICSFMYYFCVCHFVMFLVCISYLFTACQVRGRFLRPPPPPPPVPSWLTHPFSLICWPPPVRTEESRPACQAPQS